jgi:multidrug efflux system outer membrane protein
LLTAISVGYLLSLTGCGIPCHRCALPGPALPAAFSWNNRMSDNATQLATTDSSDRRTAVGSARGQTAKLISDSQPGEARQTQFVTPVSESQTNHADGTSRRTDAARSTPIAKPQPLAQPNSLSTVAIGTGEEPTLEGTWSGVNSSQLPLRQFFEDPYLVELINQAIVGNQELRILAEEIQIANNEVYSRSGEYRPFVTYGAGAGLEKSSRFTREGAVEDQLEAAPGRGFPDPLPDFIVGTNISWELDIWRRLRNAQDAAAMRYLGTQEGRNFVVTRLVAEIADNYYELLALDNRLETLLQTIEIQQQSLEIAKSKKAAGRGTELAVQRFQAEVQKNQSELAIIQQEIVEAENRINLLAGRYPQPVERASANFIDLHLNSLNAGIPAELLQNRADVRQAERNVAAAGLDVRVARARFYPALGINAGVGLNAYNTRYLLSTPESLIYNAALDLIGPLINKRAIQADYQTANAIQLQTIYDYQRTLLIAYIEVVNYVTKTENYRQSIEAKREQLKSLEASVEAANQLFQNARAEYVEVLLAQREMMEARMMLIDIKQQQLGAIVNAYQALGGGAF